MVGYNFIYLNLNKSYRLIIVKVVFQFIDPVLVELDIFLNVVQFIR